MTFGFIGTGNMGGALARAAAKTEVQVRLANRTAAKAESLAKELSCRAVTVEEAAQCEYVFLGVKPQMMAQLLAQIAPVLKQRTDSFTLVSMAAGLTMEQIRRMAGDDYPVIRMMPNTPVAVGSGIILYDATENVTHEAMAGFVYGLSHAGLLNRLPEALIDAGCAVAGCGPAYAAMFMEALADGAVVCGLPRDKAMTYAAQMLLGTAKLLLETGKHPGQLKDEVCSPGGSTIAGVDALEAAGFRGAVMSAVDAAYRRTKELGK
ncbi:MAG: pyrroline-5-carboxylate reductase [Oscillospiraceae bacterium]|nr:pyrroline-5-carboxylate reductase [Oscillospiraceae bacterium]